VDRDNDEANGIEALYLFRFFAPIFTEKGMQIVDAYRTEQDAPQRKKPQSAQVHFENAHDFSPAPKSPLSL
jgi:hypothetical protein